MEIDRLPTESLPRSGGVPAGLRHAPVVFGIIAEWVFGIIPDFVFGFVGIHSLISIRAQ